MFDHGVENRQQLVHARDQCHFRYLASRAQALIEGFDDRVVPRRSLIGETVHK
jgi:hypothetical protein